MNTKTTKTTKLTPAQYDALRRFADTPYMRTSNGSGWMLLNETDQSYDAHGDTINHRVVSALEIMGFIAPMIGCSSKSWYFDTLRIITPAGIAAYDAQATVSGGYYFAKCQAQAAAARAQRDAANEAKRIVVDGDDEMYLAGKPRTIRALLARMTTDNPMLMISTELFAADIDDMIALLTAAKRELARRETERAVSK